MSPRSRGVSLLGVAAVAAAFQASPASAEVRLVEEYAGGPLAVEIASTPRGPWTPTGSVTERVLNPHGDLFGDGMPGWDSRGEIVLSAWFRPGAAILQRALGEASGWDPLAGITASGAQGQPIVDVLTGGWAVAWQESDAGGNRVMLTGTDVDGRAATPLHVAGGLLVGTSPSGNLLQVISLDPATGRLWCTTVAFAFVPTQPIPIQLEIVSVIMLRTGGLPVGGPAPQGGSGRRDRPGDIGSLDPRLHDVMKDDGQVVGVVTWWEDDRLHAVEISGGEATVRAVSRKARTSADRDAILEATLAEIAQD